jgi:purine-binding chemotaxis protein CheW
MNMSIKQSGAHLEIVSFHLGDQEFCIDIMAIREIRGWAPVTPMPHTPPYVLGLINCAARLSRSSTWPAALA